VSHDRAGLFVILMLAVDVRSGRVPDAHGNRRAGQRATDQMDG
jgi:hypothetical protein